MNKVESRRAFKLALLPIACAGLLGACAHYETRDSVITREGPVASPVALFDRYDVNRDGFLSRGEVESLGVRSYAASDESATSAFHRLDANRDGFLSRGEAQGVLGSVPGASFEASDTDRNGFLSLNEAIPHLRWLESRNVPGGVVSFDTYDTNRDGFLSRAEAEPLWRHGRMDGNRYVIITPNPSFDALDTNRDGFISRDERPATWGASTFERYDTNRDGFLSRSEAEPLTGIGGTTGSYGGTVSGPRY